MSLRQCGAVYHFSGDEQRRKTQQLEAVSGHRGPRQETIKYVDREEQCLVVKLKLTP